MFRKYLPKLITSTAVALAASLFLCLKTSAETSETGIASVYDDWYHGKPTANGDIYNSYGNSGATCSVPYGKWVRVTNLDNGKWVVVKMNDTGGFCKSHPERIVDLSRGAFEQLGGAYPGLLRVKVHY